MLEACRPNIGTELSGETARVILQSFAQYLWYYSSGRAAFVKGLRGWPKRYLGLGDVKLPVVARHYGTRDGSILSSEV